MQIQSTWLLQKPADLDLHCLLRLGMLCSAREGLIQGFAPKSGLQDGLVVQELAKEVTKDVDLHYTWY